ncbi:MAG: zinc ribbon domain-containing protein [Candidatus Heimdallarchaeota archaeon]|nr:zinc ribbon domain-containing protein [Candidatus Heimdallarchaeota archaeon]
MINKTIILEKGISQEQIKHTLYYLFEQQQLKALIGTDTEDALDFIILKDKDRYSVTIERNPANRSITFITTDTLARERRSPTGSSTVKKLRRMSRWRVYFLVFFVMILVPLIMIISSLLPSYLRNIFFLGIVGLLYWQYRKIMSVNRPSAAAIPYEEELLQVITSALEGKREERELKVNTHTCDNCQEELAEGLNFCENCGKRLN